MVATKYLYQVVDQNGRIVQDVVTETREDAREVKRELSQQGVKARIVQYEMKGVIR